MLASQYEIRIPDKELAALNYRLDHTRWPDPAPGDEWSYGTDLRYLKELVAYWRSEFDWRRQERLLNSHPQHIAQCFARGHRIIVHYVHVKGRGPKPVPIVLTHGCCSEGTDDEFDQLDEAPMTTLHSRLGCQCVPNGTKDIVVEIPAVNKNLVREGH